ncbi:SMP-30/gluconolactonase/LRE family protein [Mesorhizobium ciceri]|uniref:SMP-30/gluconolactonase/LRE family protein n=1 Tax=Mesorhizobium ciceri TaxID=39645 RepID=UPI003B836EAD
MLTCESGNRRVVPTELDGRQTVLADSYDGKQLNSPNDIVVRSGDSIWFTDPDYGILSDYTGNRASSELGRRCVFRLDPLDGKLAIATDKLDKPNGLAFSPTEKILSLPTQARRTRLGGTHEILAFDVAADGGLGNRRTFAVIDAGVPDGFRVDLDGNIWTRAADGVHCIGKIAVPETRHKPDVWRPKRNIAAASSLYSIYVGTRGL